MVREAISPPGVGRLATPYSPALRVGTTVYVSGQVPIDPDGGLVGEGDLEAQAHQVFRNIDELLRAGGATLGDVVQITYYVRDMGEFARLLPIRRAYLSEPYPASTGVEVSRLFDERWLIEISAVAIVP